MTKEQLDQLWKLVTHQPGCRTQMVSPFEAECKCCDVVLMNISKAGAKEEREKWREAWAVAMEVIDEHVGDPPRDAYEKLKRIRGKFDAL